LGILSSRILATPTQDIDIEAFDHLAHEMVVRNVVIIVDGNRGFEAIVELVGLYFVAKEFGMSWKVVQLKVFPSERLKGYSFLCDSDEESDQSDAEPN